MVKSFPRDFVSTVLIELNSKRTSQLIEMVKLCVADIVAHQN
jgi:hypothetical protein